MEGPAVRYVFSLDDASRVGEVRRAAEFMAREEGLGEVDRGNLALVVTEVCTNVCKHAGSGETYLTRLSDRVNTPGVEIVAVDRGPGMSDVSACLADGYSTSNTAGTGLGAIARLATDWDIYSERGKGTVVMARVSPAGSSEPAVGGVVKPIAGEDASGDGWACREDERTFTVMVADGLGHGVMAARASAEAVAAFRHSNGSKPGELLDHIHRALRGTRGAAVAVMQFRNADRSIRFAGLGNISGVIAVPGKSQSMVSYSGTAGYGTPKIQEFSYQLPEAGLVIMHSDGLTTSWSLDSYPGLRTHKPSVIAAVLCRDATRGRDDTCVVAVRPRSDG
jgi:anti-sigma regulatory factor (Ser/Thr protein kinase)